MVLGLDLQGGVHFLMQVDMDAAQTQRLNSYVELIRTELREAEIRYRSVRVSGERLIVELRSEDDRTEARAIIEEEAEGLSIETGQAEGKADRKIALPVSSQRAQQLPAVDLSGSRYHFLHVELSIKRRQRRYLAAS